jgi:hypothetical protein
MISFLLLEIGVLNEKQLQSMTFMPIIWRIMVFLGLPETLGGNRH